MKKKSYKLAKLEKNRWSVFTDDFSKCYFCDNPKVDLHELLPGRNRLNSIAYGFVLPVCRIHHKELTDDYDKINEWKRTCQHYFEEHYSEDWMDVFKKNYL